MDSPWLGLMLDTGSLSEGDAYAQIERLIPYAATWQVKELIWDRGAKVKTDFPRLMGIIRKSGYRGYLPLETLGEGDPYQKVRAIYQQVSRLLN